ncbi:hypothetical protein Micbo1qcDRAFT_210862 [Microdochium bolleyi]|uniref:Uncharacterized protein n=1 Tax=Microdochium bolleyi TaxID=196109 RepID=A0A136JHP1_9PEZI|nr:hypothetical protein Micbo1qcDRAFT_210862 [Microdochium bolleyi]
MAEKTHNPEDLPELPASPVSQPPSRGIDRHRGHWHRDRKRRGSSQARRRDRQRRRLWHASPPGERQQARYQQLWDEQHIAFFRRRSSPRRRLRFLRSAGQWCADACTWTDHPWMRFFLVTTLTIVVLVICLFAVLVTVYHGSDSWRMPFGSSGNSVAGALLPPPVEAVTTTGTKSKTPGARWVVTGHITLGPSEQWFVVPAKTTTESALQTTFAMSSHGASKTDQDKTTHSSMLVASEVAVTTTATLWDGASTSEYTFGHGKHDHSPVAESSAPSGRSTVSDSGTLQFESMLFLITMGQAWWMLC